MNAPYPSHNAFATATESAARESVILNQISQITVQLETLHKEIEVIARTLSPVALPEAVAPPGANPVNRPPVPVRSELAERLASISSGIESASSRISFLRSRLEL